MKKPKPNKAPKHLSPDEIELWNDAQADLGSYCATFGAPTVIDLLLKLSKERGK
jgi:hypothetical protein